KRICFRLIWVNSWKKTADNSTSVSFSIDVLLIMIAGRIALVTQMGLSKVPQYSAGTFFKPTISAHRKQRALRRSLLHSWYPFNACFAIIERIVSWTKRIPHPHTHIQQAI